MLKSEIGRTSQRAQGLPAQGYQKNRHHLPDATPSTTLAVMVFQHTIPPELIHTILASTSSAQACQEDRCLKDRHRNLREKFIHELMQAGSSDCYITHGKILVSATLW